VLPNFFYCLISAKQHSGSLDRLLKLDMSGIEKVIPTAMNQGSDMQDSNKVQIRGGLQRTPPSSTRSANDVIHTPVRKGLKRGAEDDVHKMSFDMYDSLIERFNTLSSDIKSMESNVEKKIDDRFNELQGVMEKTSKKIQDIEVKVDENDRRIDQNTKAINLLNQKELQNKMDIVGAKWSREMKKDNIKEEVLKIIRQYKINIDDTAIKSAFMRKNGSTGMQVMVVEFSDFETKLKVMKEKRLSKTRDGIFFDNSLTPMNGKLMGAARKIAREMKFKAYLNNNRIHIRKSDDKVKWIECEADLEDVKSWIPNNDAIQRKNSGGKVNSSSAITQHTSA